MSKDDALLTTKYNDIDPTQFYDTIILTQQNFMTQ